MPDPDWERQQAAWAMRQALGALDEAIGHLRRAEEAALTVLFDGLETDIAVQAQLFEDRLTAS